MGGKSFLLIENDIPFVSSDSVEFRRFYWKVRILLFGKIYQILGEDKWDHTVFAELSLFGQYWGDIQCSSQSIDMSYLFVIFF